MNRRRFFKSLAACAAIAVVPLIWVREFIGKVIHLYPVEGDATEMIQDAIDKAGKGGTVYLHAGTYEVSRAVMGNRNVTITGKDHQ